MILGGDGAGRGSIRLATGVPIAASQQSLGETMKRMTSLTIAVALGVAIATAGCLDPKETRPGVRLTGELAATPTDWSFTNEHGLIAIEVQTPYLVPHSVTIWCAEVDGQLYVGAREPETKRWPGWADRDPDVRLGIGGQTYEVRLVPLDDPARLARLLAAYATKYDLPPPSGESPPIRYWRVAGRS
jgi:hypothetical protein